MVINKPIDPTWDCNLFWLEPWSPPATLVVILSVAVVVDLTSDGQSGSRSKRVVAARRDCETNSCSRRITLDNTNPLILIYENMTSALRIIALLLISGSPAVELWSIINVISCLEIRVP